MPCATYAYPGSPRKSVSRCKTYARSAVTVSSLQMFALSFPPVTGPIQWAQVTISEDQPTAIHHRQALEWLVALSRNPRLIPTRLLAETVGSKLRPVIDERTYPQTTQGSPVRVSYWQFSK